MVSLYVTQPGNELIIPLPQTPKCSDYKPEVPGLSYINTSNLLLKTHEKKTVTHRTDE